jgi:hypothetical protein
VSGIVSETPAATAFVTLKGGLIVALEALQLAWALEDRGARFAVEGEDLVVECPRGALTEKDRAAIQRWRSSLKVIVMYQPPDWMA